MRLSRGASDGEVGGEDGGAEGGEAAGDLLAEAVAGAGDRDDLLIEPDVHGAGSVLVWRQRIAIRGDG